MDVRERSRRHLKNNVPKNTHRTDDLIDSAEGFEESLRLEDQHSLEPSLGCFVQEPSPLVPVSQVHVGGLFNVLVMDLETFG